MVSVSDKAATKHRETLKVLTTPVRRRRLRAKTIALNRVIEVGVGTSSSRAWRAGVPSPHPRDLLAVRSVAGDQTQAELPPGNEAVRRSVRWVCRGSC